MTTLTISRDIENEINLTEDAWLIVTDGEVVAICPGRDEARKMKAECKMTGKIIEAAKCEFEVVDLAEPTSTELPDETISPEDEAEVAARLEAEEVIVLTKCESSDDNAAAVLLGDDIVTGKQIGRAHV